MVSEPAWLDVATSDVHLRALTWGPPDDVDAPIALCLHGFPDTAWTWCKVSPMPAGAWSRRSCVGMRVPVLPINLAARPFGVVGDTAAVTAVVTRLPRRRGPAACRCRESARHRWRAALGYNRAALRGGRPPAQYAGLQQYWLSAPRLSTLYLHGTDDGCSEDCTPWIERILPEGSTTALVENAGHFLQFEQPDVVARHIIDFVGADR